MTAPFYPGTDALRAEALDIVARLGAVGGLDDINADVLDGLIAASRQQAEVDSLSRLQDDRDSLVGRRSAAQLEIIASRQRSRTAGERLARAEANPVLPPDAGTPRDTERDT